MYQCSPNKAHLLRHTTTLTETLTVARPPAFPPMGDATTTAVVVPACDEDTNLARLVTGDFAIDVPFSAACCVVSTGGIGAAGADTTGATVVENEVVLSAEVAGAIGRGPLRTCSGRSRSRRAGLGVRFGKTFGVPLWAGFGVGFGKTLGVTLGAGLG